MSATAIDDSLALRPSLMARSWRFVRREPLGTFGLFLVVLMAVVGGLSEVIAPYNPTANDFSAMTEAPSLAHIMGTDQFGRDLFSRIVYGARTALIVGLSSALAGGAIGLVLGVGSAYFGGKTDLVLQRVFDIVMAFPLIILALAVVSIFGTGVQNVIVCTLCSCYPWPVLGLPPVWYKSAAYRSRVVIEPRAVLAEFGLSLAPEVEVRVWDSTAELRYMVLPERPAGTEGLNENALADLVTRDSMIGTGIVPAPADGTSR
mgnify:CR=1 FL=1